MTKSNVQFDTVIIGAGAAGLMAAGSITGKSVAVLERNEKPGKKLYITGKGRCNVTNDCQPAEFFSNVVSNPKFLYSCIYGFMPSDTCRLLSECGVHTKVERGNRVFPVSDKSSDIIRALYRRAEANDVKFFFGERVRKIERQPQGFRICTETTAYLCEKLLIATGGKSYPATGSDGDGYKFAEQLGHTVIPPRPSLVPLRTRRNVSIPAGVSLKNVTVSVCVKNKEYSQFGEMLFTHEGLSGPAVLRLSAYIGQITSPLPLRIDLKPALDEETLYKRLTSDFTAYANKQLKNAMEDLLPKALILPVLQQSELPIDKKVNVLTKEERKKLLYTLKNFSFDIIGTGSFAEAIVTSGGVCTEEVDPKTMESKKVAGLYFAGELLDVDALTGGFNIQIAFSTAYAAATAISNGE